MEDFGISNALAVTIQYYCTRPSNYRCITNYYRQHGSILTALCDSLTKHGPNIVHVETIYVKETSGARFTKGKSWPFQISNPQSQYYELLDGCGIDRWLRSAAIETPVKAMHGVILTNLATSKASSFTFSEKRPY